MKKKLGTIIGRVALSALLALALAGCQKGQEMEEPLLKEPAEVEIIRAGKTDFGEEVER